MNIFDGILVEIFGKLLLEKLRILPHSGHIDTNYWENERMSGLGRARLLPFGFCTIVVIVMIVVMDTVLGCRVAKVELLSRT